MQHMLYIMIIASFRLLVNTCGKRKKGDCPFQLLIVFAVVRAPHSHLYDKQLPAKLAVGICGQIRKKTIPDSRDVKKAGFIRLFAKKSLPEILSASFLYSFIGIFAATVPGAN